MLLNLDSFDRTSHLVKLPLYFASAIIITFALFAFMQFLIKSPGSNIQTPKAIIDVALYQVRAESKVQTKPKLTPPPKPMAAPKRNIEMPTADTHDVGIEYKPVIALDLTMDEPSPQFVAQNGQATPIVRIPAKYPVAAARDGIQGWVELSFNIDKTGRVIEAKVINAEPKRVFNKAALQALKRWKYKPKMENGKPLVQYNQSVMLEFNLEQ